MTTSPLELPGSLDVLIVIGVLNIGGAERHVSYVTQVLSRRGWRIGVYSLSGDGPLRADLETAGVNVMLPLGGQAPLRHLFILRPLWTLIAGVHLTYTMLRLRPRIVHFFLPAAYLVGAFAASLARVKIRVMKPNQKVFPKLAPFPPSP